MTEYLESFINIVYDIKSHFSVQNATSLKLLYDVLANRTLLASVANRTSLTVEYINRTVLSVLKNAENIADLYKSLNNSQDHNTIWNTTDASTCTSFGTNNLIINSFVPALIIILILSMVNKRVWKKNYCGGRPGLAIPVNLLDSYENRFCYALAFGATASRITNVILGTDYTLIFGDEFREVQEDKTIPSWFSAIYKILAAFTVGVSYYPFFSCISTHQRLLGAVIGTIYSAYWLYVYIKKFVKCGTYQSEQFNKAESIAIDVPTILCLSFLLLCFLGLFVRSLISKKRGMVISKDEWKENYKYHHVKKLLKSVPKSAQTTTITDGFKSKIISKLYKWHPDFKYSTRIVCIFLTAQICLYLVIVSYIVLSRGVGMFLDDKLQELRYDAEVAGKNGVNWTRLQEGIKVTIICWNVAIGLACVKSLIMMTNMLSWYRGHVLRLRRGDRSFLPVTIVDQNPSNIMVASFKFAGYQVAYMLWGFLITHLIIFVVIAIVTLFFVWPLILGNTNDAYILTIIVTIWPTFFISLLTILAQLLLAKYVFLRDFGATLALNNRRLFHIASYFLFFLNIFVGIFSCLLRIFYAVLFGVLFLPRLQKSALPRDWELFDPGYKTYVGYLCLEHTHTNPVLLIFSKLILDAVASEENCEDERQMEGLKLMCVRRARTRWFLAITLVNNPQLKDLRRREHFRHQKAFAAIGNLAAVMLNETSI